jgi:hypothetical protein
VLLAFFFIILLDDNKFIFYYPSRLLLLLLFIIAFFIIYKYIIFFCIYTPLKFIFVNPPPPKSPILFNKRWLLYVELLNTREKNITLVEPNWCVYHFFTFLLCITYVYILRIILPHIIFYLFLFYFLDAVFLVNHRFIVTPFVSATISNLPSSSKLVKE